MISKLQNSETINVSNLISELCNWEELHKIFNFSYYRIRKWFKFAFDRRTNSSSFFAFNHHKSNECTLQVFLFLQQSLYLFKPIS